MGNCFLDTKIDYFLTKELMGDYPDVHFLLIGDGEEREKIVKKAQQLEIKYVTMLPLQPKERISDFIAMSDLGIVVMRNVPLFQTMISAKMFEYLAMKKPVIFATGKVEGSKIVGKYNCGLVIEPEDSDRLKEAILTLYLDENLRKRLGENGFRTVQHQYNREIMAGKMLRVIFPNWEGEIFTANVFSE